MTRNVSFRMLICAACCAVVFGAGKASAQIPISGPGGGAPAFNPAFSPYLNLLRRGSSPAVNYYGIVRPQINFMGAINQLNQQVSNNELAIGDAQTMDQGTGHRVHFLNTGRYFPSLSGQGGMISNAQSSNRGVQSQSPLKINQLSTGISGSTGGRR